MKIDNDTLAQLEQLAKIQITPSEHDKTIAKITGVLTMLDCIDFESVSSVEPLYHPLEISQPLRPDSADADIDRETLQAQAPQTEAGLFLVPKVIE
ncbi:Asp-tRNA(Asn)/Glu-tRNA(Gln) amidotransferase subunit GatC [Ostreibacterium oceani]|uniref:Aspartyl/glutamyl-tRNA(Asn/Gln) amidotransferase subunit C n=1 Tax=Ostreibacterium oceani TaxID=2654998 RepID=A0A6N7EXV9_9GAMM|nr:Asp-tRNA(Asn)/Glu-tRNA(Gln) amidotransferase subunit GatC [Ostreibacterium oceani]MPV86425.1 Asp-tRNA(Asn)/Glu-tRNA(Gln) amidotransferase subunit GatC [Ostreibacterium oceani]